MVDYPIPIISTYVDAADLTYPIIPDSFCAIGMLIADKDTQSDPGVDVFAKLNSVLSATYEKTFESLPERAFITKDLIFAGAVMGFHVEPSPVIVSMK
jgi:hypothetical protein